MEDPGCSTGSPKGWGKDISLVAAIRIVKPLNGVDNNACDKRSMQSNVAHPVK